MAKPLLETDVVSTSEFPLINWEDINDVEELLKAQTLITEYLQKLPPDSLKLMFPEAGLASVGSRIAELFGETPSTDLSNPFFRAVTTWDTAWKIIADSSMGITDGQPDISQRIAEHLEKTKTEYFSENNNYANVEIDREYLLYDLCNNLAAALYAALFTKDEIVITTARLAIKEIITENIVWFHNIAKGCSDQALSKTISAAVTNSDKSIKELIDVDYFRLLSLARPKNDDSGTSADSKLKNFTNAAKASKARYFNELARTIRDSSFVSDDEKKKALNYLKLATTKKDPHILLEIAKRYSLELPKPAYSQILYAYTMHSIMAHNIVAFIDIFGESNASEKFDEFRAWAEKIGPAANAIHDCNSRIIDNIVAADNDGLPTVGEVFGDGYTLLDFSPLPNGGHSGVTRGCEGLQRNLENSYKPAELDLNRLRVLNSVESWASEHGFTVKKYWRPPDPKLILEKGSYFDEYALLVLTKELPDGSIQTIVVGESPVTNNAAYMMRLECGDDGDERTWQELMSLHKTTARQLPQFSRILHVGSIEDLTDRICKRIDAPPDEYVKYFAGPKVERKMGGMALAQATKD